MSSQPKPDAVEEDETNPRRERILQAAIEEFASVGFAGARVDRIAESSGCSKQLIYYYFQTKANLWESALAAMTVSPSNDLRESHGELAESIRKQIKLSPTTPRVWSKLLAWEGAEFSEGAVPAKYEARRANWEKRIDQVRRAQARGEIDGRFDPEMLVLALTLITTGPHTLRQLTKLITGNEAKTQEFSDRLLEFVDLLLPALRPPSA